MSDVSLEYGLKRLGLKQEFKRELGGQASFALSFVMMSPFVGLASDLGYAWDTGGPGPAVWGWKLVFLLNLCTCLSLAEILSGLPCSGGPYYWVSILGGRYGALLSWITGWCNVVGLIALTASTAQATLYTAVGMVQILTGVVLSPEVQVLMLWGVLVVAGCFNSASSAMLTRCMFCGAFINIAGVIGVVLLLPTVGPWHHSATFVFATFYDMSLSPFTVPSNAYLWVQGILLALATLTGFDGCCHLSEETKGANSSAPLAMLWSMTASAFIGYVLLLGTMFCTQKPLNLINPVAAGEGFAAGQLVWDVFASRFGSGHWCISVLIVFLVTGVMSTIACVTSTSRMMFSFGRSRALPFSRFFTCLDRRNNMPLRTVWLATGLTCAMGILLLVPDSEFFGDMTSYGFAGLQIAHGLPIICRLTISRHSFEPGPIHLGKWSAPIGWISVAWNIVGLVVLSLPPTFPVTLDELQLPLFVVLLGSLVSWFAGARHWYIDPKEQATLANTKPRSSHDKQLGTMGTEALLARTMRRS